MNFRQLELLESRHLLAADVVINEIHFNPPDRNTPSEFIELYNSGDTAADLSGYRFTSGIDFTFPPGTIIGPDKYAVVSESVEGYQAAFGQARGQDVIAYQLETRTRGNQNFEGSLGMDFVVNRAVMVTELGVFDSNGTGLRRELQAQLWRRDDGGTPDNFADDSGVDVVAEQLFPADDAATLVGGSRFVPLPEPVTLEPGAYTIVAFGYGRRETVFNGEGSAAGATDTGNGLLSFVGASRFGEAGQFPATVDTGPANRYGAGTFRFSAVEALPPFAQPTGIWSGRLANEGESVVLRDAQGTIVDEVTFDVGFPWPTKSQGEGASLELRNPLIDKTLGGSWRASVDGPTPGLPNSVLTTNIGPTLRQVQHSPASPTSGQDVVITVKATDADQVSSVILEYQLVEPGQYIRLSDPEYQTNWLSLTMRDDGLDNDAVAGDDVFTVTLPSDVQVHRRLVRYRFHASDARSDSTAAPYDDDPQPNFAYFVYDGVPGWTGADRPGRTDPVTYDSDVMRSLPAYHLIATSSDVTDSQYTQRFNGVRFVGTLVFNGTVYDHIEFNNRGQFSTYVTGKNKWKLHFTRGHEFQPLDDFGRPWKTKVRKLNFGTAASPWARPNRGLSGMDEALAFKFFNLAGVAAPRVSAFQLRVIDDSVEADPESQYNGDLWGLYLAFEDPGGRFLEEHGLPDGNLFRMQSGGVELRHHGIGLPDDQSDVREFVSTRTGYNKRNPVQPVQWWRDNVDLDTYYSYRAVIEAVNHSDLRDQENSLQYYNSESGKWTQLPWDLDLLYEEFDRWGPDGVQTTTPLEQFRKALEHDELKLEFQARLREMQDLFFNTDQAWQAVEEYARYVEPLAAVDRAMWDWNPRTSSIHKGFFYRSPAPYHGGADGEVRRELTSPSFEGMVDWVKEFIVPGGFGGDQTVVLHTDPDIPETPVIQYVGDDLQPINRLRFQTSAFRDPQGNDTFGAIQWRIGEVTSEAAPVYDPAAPLHFEVGAVWESGTLTEFADTISVDAHNLEVGHAYRARVRQQDATGRWSHWSAPYQFVTTDAVPDNVHRLRISELNYHPHDALTQFGEMNVDADSFEYIELTNTGDSAVDLQGVRLARQTTNSGQAGVQFIFESQSLEPNERLVVVRDRLAFQSRYGEGIRIAAGSSDGATSDGQFGGGLSNGGELITLLDSLGGVIQAFTYDDSADWPQRADGGGSSLEVVDSGGDYDDPRNWRASSQFGGSPTTEATAANTSVVINEVLSRTDLPDVDWIELYNATAADIDIQGWYISDSENDYFRFQVESPLVVPMHSYVVIDQTQLGFGLNGSVGDDVWLIEADASGRPLRFADHIQFGGATVGMTFGRWPNGFGQLVPMTIPTMGTMNAGRVIGDSNSDGVFDQLDLVLTLQGAKYLADRPATFEEGDWNSDGRFDSLDIVFALSSGDYRA